MRSRVLLLVVASGVVGCSLIVEDQIAQIGQRDAGAPLGTFCNTAQDCFEDPETWNNCMQTCQIADADERGHCVAGPAAPDGVVCGGSDGAEICVAGACVMRRCGDRFIDRAAGEYCDDGNTNDADLCKNTCTRSCLPPATPSCVEMPPNSADPCTGGAGVCDSTGTGECQPMDALADGSDCMLADAMPGRCQTGRCIPLLP